ncbi:aldehyde dehydrogenase family protein [Aeromicrobium fastidiosum]|uniref:Aldehyde dehydrogenase family protein n=1 Tax=Aeromicrobium fastidiosum TaxID=52699 RepID=A0A641AR78_9ACTN|nr:aldehyde dehydrogenase family protein [Aeromicrobium fastidiosum]KAA1380590.1 aldehyde dehydrogenase family protein [Aeromicrobium fastidiosum]MBP2390189.1 gamma-glutamyl-gamma-aminobutyraldehyde dehydrogenase [Aeromicrobium fastidiosum]
MTVTDIVTTTDWVRRAKDMVVPAGIFVDGEMRAAAGTRAIRTPRDGSVIGELAWAGEGDVDVAVAAARRAFDHGPWPRMHPRERGEILQAFSALVHEHRDELALLVSLEMGKPIRAAHDIELRALVRTLRYYGEIADKEHGEVTPTTDGELSLVTREPSGVVASVVSWNFPLTLAGWKFAPALAAGCAVVLKTAEQSPLSMQRVAELGAQAGLPPGVLNVLSGDGVVVGRALGLHRDVDVLTFTGSTAVGRHFLRYSADSNLKRVQLELGGKSPNIIFPDAPDLDAAADTAAWAIFFNSGEMCTAGSRLVVHRDVADQVVDRIVRTSASWAPGDPLDPTTTMGPLVDQSALDRVLGQLEEGIAAGGRVLTGGRQARPDSGGPYLEPTVVTGLGRDNLLVREELFAPVLSVLEVADEDEAVAVAGDTPYGLAAAVWTSDLGTAHRVAKRLKAGTVWVNCYEEGDLSVPFGGVKLSGFGRDKSRHALDEYTDLKTTWIAHG